MNEKIKELAELAAHNTRVKHNNAYWRMQQEMAEDNTWREKFAELIIEECIHVIIQSHNGHINPKFVVDPLKHHFRVEE